jgi:hypothetical protein
MHSINKPLASLSLDLDDKWSYMKVRGDANWASYPSYLEIVIPRVLEFLDARSQKLTVFVVGQDAALPRNHSLLRSMSQAGHEICNHSFRHEPWLHLYSRPEIDRELALAERAIELATGVRTRGFRGPGFSVSNDVIEALIERGYCYDASTFPTYLGPLARAYYFLTAQLDESQRNQRGALFGSFRDGLRPLRLHPWVTESGSIPELPVTTMPGIRTPFHLSYLVYLSSYSKALAKAYLSLAILLCKWHGIGPSFLLHPLDFLGPDEAPELSFFPGMKLSLRHKLELADLALSAIAKHFELLPLHRYVKEQEAKSATQVAFDHAVRRDS